MNVKSLIKIPLFFNLAVLSLGCTHNEFSQKKLKNPNILILMSDNQSWNHLGCYGDPIVKTPIIDSLAKTGIRFTNAYCSAPSCAPARAAMLTGQDFWRLEEAANLWGTFPAKFNVYTELLEEAGYLVGFEGKGWGLGYFEPGGWQRNPGGNNFNSFNEFYNKKEKGQSFCYWFSSRDPHRPYKPNGWEELATDFENIVVPDYLPNHIDTKKDIGEYYAKIQDFDNDVKQFIELLKERGDFENTLIIICSDNGWQMPRGLANLYDFGTRIPLIAHMPSKYKGGRVIDDFVSLNDFAPTFLQVAKITVPEEMNARSFLNILESEEEGIIENTRNFIVMGRERHAFVRQNGEGYGARAYRTNEFLYIRNYDYEKWPAGDPPLFGDVDAHMLHYSCPTKLYILKNKNIDSVKKFFDLGFGKRPAEELYDLIKDPFQMNNVAYLEEYKKEKNSLSEKLTKYLKLNGDPRETGDDIKWLGAPYYAEKDKFPSPNEEARRELNLNKQYSYILE